MTVGGDTSHVRRLYDEMAGNWRMLGIIDSLLLVKRLRRKHFASAAGEVLDVGCGTGENFDFLVRADLIAALDLSPEMTLEAKRRAAEIGKQVALLAGDAQLMPFPDDRFDTVISAFSSCTFPDYAAAFREMVRVTRPGGRILLLEHGRSSFGPIARRQNRKSRRIYERSGCRNNRVVLADLAEAGLAPTAHVVSRLGTMSRIVIDVDRKEGVRI